LTHSIFFMPAARLELIEAVDWYQRQTPGLGHRFGDEVDFQVSRITANPFQFPEMLPGVRRARLRRFPYGLFFLSSRDAVHVIACFHSSRDPVVWRSRI
jgi:toxin ParE1/3/4